MRLLCFVDAESLILYSHHATCGYTKRTQLLWIVFLLLENQIVVEHIWNMYIFVSFEWICFSAVIFQVEYFHICVLDRVARKSQKRSATRPKIIHFFLFQRNVCEIFLLECKFHLVRSRKTENSFTQFRYLYRIQWNNYPRIVLSYFFLSVHLWFTFVINFISRSRFIPNVGNSNDDMANNKKNWCRKIAMKLYNKGESKLCIK